MRKKSVRDLDVRGKRVLVRVDFNVPLSEGAVADDSRIQAAAPTLQYILDNGGSVVAFSHLGRANGKVRDALRMRPVAECLSQVLKRPVKMASGCVGRGVEKQANALQTGEVLLLENLRFHPGEEANAPRFAAQLAKLGDVYVNDAFGAAHRAHASTEGLAHLLPAAAGLLLERELDQLTGVFGPQSGKTMVVSGGAKVSDKLGLLEALVQQAAVVCLGGAMANTFLLSRGTEIGASLAEPEMVEQAREITAAADKSGCELLLPIDGVVAQGPERPPRARPLIFAEEGAPAGWQILDVGPGTIELFGKSLREADVAVWNGPLGLFEREAFAGGTRAMANLFAKLSARTIVCGGETVQAVRAAGVDDKMGHISTGGGAALALLEGRTLPGAAALPDAQ